MSLARNFNSILGRPQVPRMLANLGWLIGDKIVRMGLGLVVGVAVARHLGPTHFGALNYALALVGLLNVFASLGLDSITQRDLIQRPDERWKILGTCFGLKVCCSLLCYVALLVIVTFDAPEPQTRTACLIIGLTILGGSAGVFDFWFQSQLTAKYSIYAQNIAFAVASLLRLFLVWSGANLAAFAWAIVLEGMLAALIYTALYEGTEKALGSWSFDSRRAKNWLTECWPLVLASLAVSIYMRIDQVMLAKMSGDHAVGIYSVAVRISEIGYFIPMMLASTLLPSVSRSREAGEAVYQRRRQHYFDLSSVLALALIIPSSLLADRLVYRLYGPTYEEAGAILLVHIWSALFVFIGVARGQYLLIEGQLKFSFYATLAGAVLNVFLNFALIPRYGGLGSAWATLIAYAGSAFFSSFLNSAVLPMGFQQLKSFNFPMAIYRLMYVR